MGFMNAGEFEYVGFWARVLATLIDTAIVSVVTWPFLDRAYDGLLNLQADTSLSTALTMSRSDIVSLALAAIGIILFWMARQATPGKMVIRAQIVDATTLAKPTTRQVLLRYLGYYVSMIALFAGFVWVAIDPRKQGWHDKMANTVVIRQLPRPKITAHK